VLLAPMLWFLLCPLLLCPLRLFLLLLLCMLFCGAVLLAILMPGVAVPLYLLIQLQWRHLTRTTIFRNTTTTTAAAARRAGDRWEGGSPFGMAFLYFFSCPS
jgi:hypothetical protein